MDKYLSKNRFLKKESKKTSFFHIHSLSYQKKYIKFNLKTQITIIKQYNWHIISNITTFTI